MARKRAEPSILLGPILYFRGEQRDRWWLSALFVLDGDVEPDDLKVDGVTLPVPPRHLVTRRHGRSRRHVWRFDFAVPRGLHDTDVTYGFPDGPRWTIVVPGRHSFPRMAVLYGSGTSTAPSPDPSSTLWPALLARHAIERLHLLVQTGGQADGDAALADSPRLARALADAVGGASPQTPALAGELMNAAFDHLLRVWRGSAVAQALASIPSVMIWDGTELGRGLADAWDCREEAPADRRLRPLVDAIRQQAHLFQTGSVPESPPDALWGADCGSQTQGIRLGEAGLLLLDLWSDRSGGRMLSNRSWELLPDWLDRFAGCRHLILVSTAPLLPGAAPLIRLHGLLPSRLRGHLGSRVRSGWTATDRTGERERMLRSLADFSRRTGCRITILSSTPDCESGRTVLRGGGLEMWQLYVPRFGQSPTRPSRWAGLIGRRVGRPGTALSGYRLETPAFDDGQRLLRGPGWLACTLDGKGQLHANWCRPDDTAHHSQAI